MRVKPGRLMCRAAGALACGAVLVGVAACGSSSPDRLTKQQYLHELKAIGKDLDGAFEQTFGPDLDTSNLRTAANAIDKGADFFDKLAHRVDALVPPEEVQATQDKLVHGLRTFADTFRRIADKIRTAPAVELQDYAEQLVGPNGDFDPTKAPGATEIQKAIEEFKAKGYEVAPDEPRTTVSAAPEKVPGNVANGKKVFASSGCGGCHTLADAGTSGSVGPNLDEVKPAYAKALDRVTNGTGIMPSFKSMLTQQQLVDVASYAVSASR